MRSAVAESVRGELRRPMEQVQSSVCESGEGRRPCEAVAAHLTRPKWEAEVVHGAGIS